MVRRSTPLLLAVLLAAAVPAAAQNPIVPPGVYIADPTARVWDDGRVYVYGSRDESPDYYCSHRYHVLSLRGAHHLCPRREHPRSGDDDAGRRGTSETTFTARVAPGKAPTRMQVTADSLFGWGTPLGEIDVPDGGDGEEWVTVTAKFASPPSHSRACDEEPPERHPARRS